MKKFTIDISPLKKYRDFRLLWTSGLISRFGSMMTYVAMPFQIKLLTNSYLAVSLMGAIEIIPLVIFGLYGGVLADSVDRKKMIWITEGIALFISLGLFVNSLLPHPHLVALYVAAALFSAVNGLHSPSAGSILPRMVSHGDLPNASALMSLQGQFGVITGPAVAGILISTVNVSAGYLVDVISYIASVALLLRIQSFPPNEKNESILETPIKSLVAGVKYAASRRDLLGTYVVDLAAMFFAMPNALYPFWADQIHARWALGFFYASGTVGALFVTLTSRWINTYKFHGRAVLFAALGWGAAISFAGYFTSLPLIIFFLAVAGAADMVSALFRSAIWNQSIPDSYRGRLAGIELLSYSVGPLGGQMRAGSMAALTSLRTSVISGGLLCIGVVSIAGTSLKKFRNYDVTTNPFAIRQREVREMETGKSFGE
ncbi:MAG: MFS transporter [Actinomycetes bacterium]